ncbi:hypothetical protein ABPG72_022398 [Tetrahymena utriculariae]
MKLFQQERGSKQERHISLVLGVNYVKSRQIKQEVFNHIASYAASLKGVQVPSDQYPVDIPWFRTLFDGYLFSFEIIVDSERNDKMKILDQISNFVLLFSPKCSKFYPIEVISEKQWKLEKQDLKQCIVDNVQDTLEDLKLQINKLNITQQQMNSFQSQIQDLLRKLFTFYESNQQCQSFQNVIMYNNNFIDQQQAKLRSDSFFDNHNSTEKESTKNKSEEICSQQLLEVQKIEMKSTISFDQNKIKNQQFQEELKIKQDYSKQTDLNDIVQMLNFFCLNDERQQIDVINSKEQISLSIDNKSFEEKSNNNNNPMLLRIKIFVENGVEENQQLNISANAFDEEVQLRFNKVSEDFDNYSNIHYKKFVQNKDQRDIACYLNDKNIKALQVAQIAKGISLCKNLQQLKLDLSQNQIQSQGAFLLGEGISDCRSLKSLTILLKNNYILVEGAQSILEKISTCSEIQYLFVDMSKNSIKDKKEFKLKMCCFKISLFQKFSLSQNIGNLSNLKSLKMILSSNQIGNYGISQLGLGISKCYQLENLTLNFQQLIYQIK